MLPSQRWLKLVVLATALGFVGIAVYVYAFRFGNWIESDAAVQVLLGAKALHHELPIVADWYYANGDVWVLGPQLLAVVPIVVLGVGPASLLVTVVLGLVIELAILVRIYGRLAGAGWIGALAAMVTLMPWSQSHVAFIYVQLAYGFLTVLYLVAFTSFASFAIGATVRPVRWMTAGLFVAIVVAQNPIRGFVFVLAPLVVGCLWPWCDLVRRRRLTLLATATAGWLAGFAVYRFALTGWVTFSQPSGHTDLVLQHLPGIARNVGKLVRGLVMLAGGDGGLRAIPGVFVMAGGFALVGRELFAARSITAIRFLCVVVVGQLAASIVPMLLSNVLDGPTAVRYAMPSLLALSGLATLLAVRALADAGWWRKLAIAWLVAVPIGAVVASPNARPPVPDMAAWPDVPELERVADALVQRGLTHGFADSLVANILTVESRGAALTCPVFVKDIIYPQRWLADTACYAAATLPPRYYVVSNQNVHDRTSRDATLPAPLERFTVGDTYEVSVYRTADTALAWLDLPLPDYELASLPIRMPATDLTLRHGKVAVESGRLVATGEPGSIVYGPYLSLPRGRYEATWSGSGMSSHGTLQFRVTADSGKQMLTQVATPATALTTTPGPLVHLAFELDRRRDNLEFGVTSADGGRVALDALVIELR